MLSPLQVRARRQAVEDYDAVGRDDVRDLIEELRREAEAERARARDASRVAEQLRAVERASRTIESDKRGLGLRLSVHDGDDPLEFSRTGRLEYLQTAYDPDRFEDRPAGWDVSLWWDAQWDQIPEHDDPSYGLADAFAWWMKQHAETAWDQCADGSREPSTMGDVEGLAAAMAEAESGRSAEISESATWCEARAEALEWRLLNPSAEVPEDHEALAPDAASDDPPDSPSSPSREEQRVKVIAKAFVDAATDAGHPLYEDLQRPWDTQALKDFGAKAISMSPQTAWRAFVAAGVVAKVKKGAPSFDLPGRIERLLKHAPHLVEEQQRQLDEVVNVVLDVAGEPR